MKREAFRHPKTFDLAARLGIQNAYAFAHVAYLLNAAADIAPQGDIGKWPNGVIARSSEWNGDADEFVEALIASGWLDRHPEARLLIHDWPDHSERWLKAKLAKVRQWFHYGYYVDTHREWDAPEGMAIAIPTTARPTDRSAVPTVDVSPPRDQTKPRQTKPNPDKPNLVSPDGEAGTAPSAVDEFVSTWNASPGVVRVRDMSDKRIKLLKARLESPGWAALWREAVKKFPLKCFANNPNGWKPDIDWFLRPDAVTKILEGKYDWEKGNGNQRTVAIGPGQTYDPAAPVESW